METNFNVVTLTNKVSDIPNIYNNILNSPRVVKWHIFVNNCSDDDRGIFEEKLSRLSQVEIHQITEHHNFSYNRAAAMIQAANSCRATNDWIMTFDADDQLEFKYITKLDSYKEDTAAVIVPKYELIYPDKKSIVETGMPTDLDSYLKDKVFTFNWQIIFRARIIKSVFKLTDPSISHYDEALPQVRLYNDFPGQIAYDEEIFLAHYNRNPGTLSNRGNYFIFMSDIIVVLQELLFVLGIDHKDDILQYCKDRVDYILRKASDEDKPYLTETWNRTVRDLMEK